MKTKPLIIGFAVTLAIFLGVNLYLYTKILNATSGEFTYGLDDPYIHLSMAKNLALHGVWGISEQNATSSSSSPLWTLILALVFKIFGTNDLVPLYANIFLSIVLILQLFKLLSKFSLSPIKIVIWANIVIYGAYIPRVVFMGMEHILHVVLIVYLVMRFCELLQDEKKLGLSFFVAVFLMSAARYESMIIIGILILTLIYFKYYKYAILTLISGILPVLIMGIVSLSMGGWLLPNSVLLRRTVFEFRWVFPLTLMHNFYSSLETRYEYPIIFTLIFSMFLFIDPKGHRKYLSFLSLAGLSLGTAIIHSMIGYIVLRYFFYISVMMMVTLAIGYLLIFEDKLLKFEKSFNQLETLKFIIALFLGVGLIWNGVMHTRRAALASKNIYEQQIQTAKFFDEYYPHRGVALNDIGAVSFYSRARIIDVAGLANNKIASLINENELNSISLKEALFAEDTKIIALPKVVLQFFSIDSLKWKQAGIWKIQKNVVSASDEVHFFGINDAEAELLRENLIKFNPRLPKDVIVRIISKDQRMEESR